MSKYVYLIEAGEGGPIKIGVALHVGSRVKELQGANAQQLRVLASVPGDHKMERELHRRFTAERLNGEWFRGDGAVRAFAIEIARMPTEEAAISLRPSAPKSVKPPKQPKPPKPPKPARPPRRRKDRLSPEQLHSMFCVGDDGNIFRSPEAEALLAEHEERKCRLHISVSKESATRWLDRREVTP